jgi:hypothetical protein
MLGTITDGHVPGSCWLHVLCSKQAGGGQHERFVVRWQRDHDFSRENMSSFFRNVVWDVISTDSTLIALISHFKPVQTPGNSLSRLPRYRYPSDASHSPPASAAGGMAFLLQLHWKDSGGTLGSCEVDVSILGLERTVGQCAAFKLVDETRTKCVSWKLPARLEKELVQRESQHLVLTTVLVSRRGGRRG